MISLHIVILANYSFLFKKVRVKNRILSDCILYTVCEAEEETHEIFVRGFEIIINIFTIALNLFN